ncbi:TPA: MFS transporter [Legionella pneumophila]|uniref:MFS transporter n=3 Tax=Legionella pneumophila TaxID=446 RepID=A0A3A6VJQ2_LEGPN|nr:MFS transporter [Legionella pneumophila]ANN96519.1 MFS transporter [Legionella pneumophila]ERB40343.1 MFS transporter [Legionella pneumophila str. 121004]MCW8405877.1 MFS transporter [Legionella pneumophila]MCW8432432.1 MFS transporter [Legionella pneumophila]MCW8463624.1 MFS transporter [Legionella pneumophila]
MPSGILALGFVSMLTDLSSELIFSLLPVFLVSVLGTNALVIGLIEGFAESIALLIRIFSGMYSDYLGKRKTLAIFGYSFSALSKPLFALATNIGMVFLARFLDRIGKGMRGSPRDALIADIAPDNQYGAAYGLRQSLDTVGAIIGPLLALVLMIIWNNNFQAVFWVAVIPGVLSVLVLILFVQEPVKPASAKPINPIQPKEIKKLSHAYWYVVIIGAIFTLARFSEAFLLLRAYQVGSPITWVPLILVVMYLMYSVSAYPFGKLADTINHSKLLIIGLFILITADLILAFSHSLMFIYIGSCLWGLHMGATQGLLAAMVAGTAPDDLRGTAFGFFNFICGIATLIASLLAGLLWDSFGSVFTFSIGALFCVVCLLGIGLMPRIIAKT